MPDNDTVYDVIVVGAGNAALSAAIAAREQTQSVLVVEKAPEYFRGGNTYFTGGIIRFAYNGLDDIKGLIPDMSETEANSIEVGQYTENQFYDDMMRVTHGLSDPELAEILVSQSYPTMKWLQEHGVRFVLSFGRQAFRDGDKFRFWGGLVVEAVGAGKGLSDQQFDVCQQMGVEVRYATEGVSLIQDQRGQVAGLRVKGPDGFENLAGRTVILAAGGFEANAEMRCRYLGPGWETVKVRGIPIQHRRRHPHGAGSGRPILRTLVILPRRGVGYERSRLRRPDDYRAVPEALLSLRSNGESQRRAVPGRGG